LEEAASLEEEAPVDDTLQIEARADSILDG